MLAELEVVHTQTHDRRPLATLRNLPGNDADMTPAQMRALAAALEAAASECEQRPMDRKHFSRTVKSYPMTPNAQVKNKTTEINDNAAWQPIETAPMDGRTQILLKVPYNQNGVLAWSNTWWTCGFSVECKPTHWKPAPNAEIRG